MKHPAVKILFALLVSSGSSAYAFNIYPGSMCQATAIDERAKQTENFIQSPVRLSTSIANNSRYWLNFKVVCPLVADTTKAFGSAKVLLTRSGSEGWPEPSDNDKRPIRYDLISVDANNTTDMQPDGTMSKSIVLATSNAKGALTFNFRNRPLTSHTIICDLPGGIELTHYYSTFF